jgi:hypothetical protein
LVGCDVRIYVSMAGSFLSFTFTSDKVNIMYSMGLVVQSKGQ